MVAGPLSPSIPLSVCQKWSARFAPMNVCEHADAWMRFWSTRPVQADEIGVDRLSRGLSNELTSRGAEPFQSSVVPNLRNASGLRMLLP